MFQVSYCPFLDQMWTCHGLLLTVAPLLAGTTWWRKAAWGASTWRMNLTKRRGRIHSQPWQQPRALTTASWLTLCGRDARVHSSYRPSGHVLSNSIRDCIDPGWMHGRCIMPYGDPKVVSGQGCRCSGTCGERGCSRIIFWIVSCSCLTSKTNKNTWNQKRGFTSLGTHIPHSIQLKAKLN